MSGGKGVLTYLIARVRALLPEDWSGRAGELFREGTQKMSDFAKSRHDLLQEGMELGSRKLVGLANQEFTASEKNIADAAKSFAEREDKEIDAELKRRALESDITKRQADARKANAEADLAEIGVAQALYDFQKKLAAEGVVLSRGPSGTLQFIPSSSPTAE